MGVFVRTSGRITGRPAGSLPVALSMVLMVACVTPAAAQSAPPAPTQTEPGGFDGLLETMGLKAKVVPPPDFVRKSRPSDDKLNYVPVGAPPPVANPVKTMTPAEIAAKTEELDQIRMTQQRKAGLKPVPVPLKSKNAPRTSPLSIR